MKKEIITNKQGIFIMTMFIIGSFIIIGAGGEAKQDVWLVILLALVMSMPMVLVYSALLKLHPGKDICDILIITFGRVAGKFMALLMVWYCLHLGALVIRNFSSFVNIVSFPETPQSVIVIFIGLFCIWMVKAGIEVFGRWTAFIFPTIMLIIVVTAFLSMTRANFINLRPVLSKGIFPLLPVAFGIFSFPFAETVVFTFIFETVNDNKKVFRVFLYSLLIGSIFMISIAIRNVLVLGTALNSILYFPSYAAVRTINIGNFLQRFEVVVAIIFIFGGFVKISVCLLATSKGVAKIFGFKSYRDIVVPIGFLMMVFSCIVYEDTMEMFQWAQKIYPYYAIPFQIVLPIFILTVAKIKTRLAEKNKKYTS